MPDPRFAYIVGAVKIPYADRNVAHQVITPHDDRGYFNIIGADDTPSSDSALPVGANVTYRVELTETEAAQFAAASNCRYVELDQVEHDAAGAVSTPAASSMAFMGADFPRVDLFHGRDVLIGMLDGGTTTAVRSYLGVTMVARKVFSTDQPGSDEITSAHGCLVAGQLLPIGGKFLDAIVSENNGNRSSATSSAAARWCADQGAKIVNYSGGGSTPNSVWTDALQYLKDRGVEFFASAGNDGLNQLSYPAAYSTTYSNCHSSISFDEQTNTRSTFSNYDNTGSGCAPGTNVIGFTPDGVPTPTSGTSMSSPHMALLCAMGCTGSKYTPAQVGAALKANTRDTGQPAEEQGGGAYDLEAALTALGALAGLPTQTLRRNLNPNPSFEVNTTGYLVESVRTGITATAVARATSIATPFGTGYGSTNVTGDGTTSTTEPDVEIALPSVAVTGGQSYVFSVHSRHTVTGASLEWSVQWENSTGTTLGTAKGGRQPLLTTVWARYHFTAAAPPGATKAVLWLLGSGFTDATARSWRWDGFQYEQTASLKTYFDGSTSGGTWTGTAHNSTSTIGTDTGGGTTTPGGGTTPGTGGSDVGAVLIIKAPTGVNTITNNRLFTSVAAAGLTLSGGAYLRAGVGPQLMKLERADVGIAGDPNELDGTGLSITGVPGDIGGGGTPTPGGGTGGGGGTGSADNPGDLLKVGLDSGFSKFNIGIGFLSGDPLDRDGDGHVDFTLAEIGNGLVVPGHFEMTSDNAAVRLTVPASAGTTSTNTKNPRTEFRELQQSGNGSSSHPKAAWDPTKNDHKCFARGRVIHAPSQKPEIVMVQSHDAADDTSMLRYQGGKLQCRIGDTVLSIGSINWNLNTFYDYGIQVTAGQVKFWFGPVGAPTVVYSGSFGWSTAQYFKTGCYLQANESNVDADEYGAIDMSAVMCWHTGDPEPAVHLG
jgi:hypothetical protein